MKDITSNRSSLNSLHILISNSLRNKKHCEAIEWFCRGTFEEVFVRVYKAKGNYLN